MPNSKEFVSSSESDSDSDAGAKKKSKKAAKRPREDSPDSPPPKKAAEKKNEKKLPPKGKDGEYSFQIAKMRFATVSEFRGKVMVGIREFYEADGEIKPGRKGISLSLDQWNKLKDLMEDIDEAIKLF